MVEMIQRARQRLVEALGDTFRDELGRFDALVPAPSALRELAVQLRDVADDLRRLPATVTVSSRPVMLPDVPSLERPADDGRGEPVAAGVGAGDAGAEDAAAAKDAPTDETTADGRTAPETVVAER